jgi:hypothetical protein
MHPSACSYAAATDLDTAAARMVLAQLLPPALATCTLLLSFHTAPAACGPGAAAAV